MISRKIGRHFPAHVRVCEILGSNMRRVGKGRAKRKIDDRKAGHTWHEKEISIV